MGITGWIRAAVCLWLILNTFGLISPRQLSDVMKENIQEDTHFDLLPSGAKKIEDNSTSDQNTSTACLPHEYGPSCTYCTPHNTCVDGYYTCNKTTGDKICMPGWHGGHCNRKQEMEKYHVTCPESQCRNGGSCVSQQCCCNEGFTGILCEIETIECTNTSCANGGICKDEIGSFSCICKPGFTGNQCENHVTSSLQTTTSRDSHCQSTTCQNGGRCFEDAYYTYCVCPTGYTGENCETRLLSNTTGIQSCPANHYGEKCDVICIPRNNCHNGHFVCDPLTGSKICLEGWIGKNCDNRKLPQQIDPICPEIFGCKNDGQCFEKQCCCKHNYTGSICNIESIGCLSNPCVNNATCYPSGNSYWCDCDAGFTGKQCETQIAPTSSFVWSTTVESSVQNIGTTSLYLTSSLFSFFSSNTPAVLTDSILRQSHAGMETKSPLLSSSSSLISSENTITDSQYKPDQTLETSYTPMHTVYQSSSASSISQIVTPLSSLSNNPLSTQLYTSILIDSSETSTYSGVLLSSQVYSTQVLQKQTSDINNKLIQTISSRTISSSSPLLSIASSILTSELALAVTTISSLDTITPSVDISPTYSYTYTDVTTVRTDKTSAFITPTYLDPSETVLTSVLSQHLTGMIGTRTDTKESVVSTKLSKDSKYSVLKSDLMSLSSNLSVTEASSLLSTSPPTIPDSSYNIVATESHVVSPSSTTSTTISPTFTTNSSNATSERKPDDIQNTIDTKSDSSENSLPWWVILLIVAGVMAVLAVIITVVVMRIQQMRSDSRNLERKPEMINAYDKEHFSAQPDFQNRNFDMQDADSDDDNIKHDMYIVNE